MVSYEYKNFVLNREEDFTYKSKFKRNREHLVRNFLRKAMVGNEIIIDEDSYTVEDTDRTVRSRVIIKLSEGRLEYDEEGGLYHVLNGSVNPTKEVTIIH